MKKRLFIVLGIILGAILLYFFVIKDMVMRSRSVKNYPFMKDWNMRKINAYFTWYTRESWDKDNYAQRELDFYNGKDENIINDGFWRDQWEEYWDKIQSRDKLNEAGLKIG